MPTCISNYTSIRIFHSFPISTSTSCSSVVFCTSGSSATAVAAILQNASKCLTGKNCGSSNCHKWAKIPL